MGVYQNVHMYGCILERTYVWVYTRMYICTGVYQNEHIYGCILEHTYVWVYTRTYICTGVYSNEHMYGCICGQMCVYLQKSCIYLYPSMEGGVLESERKKLPLVMTLDRQFLWWMFVRYADCSCLIWQKCAGRLSLFGAGLTFVGQ